MMELVKAISVNVLPNYQLEITFSNWFCGIKDCSELITKWFWVFKTLQDRHEFEKAKIIHHWCAIWRTDEIDLDAHGCYLDIISKPKIMSPQISAFLWIKVYMYNDDHNPPHFHVQYSEYTAVFDIKSLWLIFY